MVKNKKNIRMIAIIIILLCSNLITWLNSPSLQAIRRVDILIIFVGGLLTAALIFNLRELYLSRNKMEKVSH